MTKCCTKRPNCDSQPKCTKKSNVFILTLMFTTFNIFFIIFRILLIKREELQDIPPGVLNHIWWYLMFILFLEIQLVALYSWYYITLDTIKGLKELLIKLKYYIKEFFGIRVTNSLMKWLTLVDTDWWLYKIFCFICIIIYIGLIFALVFGYILVVLLFGPYLLGYYKMNDPK